MALRTKLYLRRLKRGLIRLRHDWRGNVAVTFAIAMIPILAFVGAAIDFSRANAVKAKMQAALDSTALILSQNASSLNSEDLQAEAQKYFVALFDSPNVKDVTLTADYSQASGSTVVLNGSAKIDTEFMSILGYKTITISGSSTTKWGLTRLRVALVLDNTG